jgi:IS66 Orf2 like protein
MIHLPASVRVYLCLAPTDMRRSFDGLYALVRDHLQLDASLDTFISSSTGDVTGSKSYIGTATDSRFGRNVWRKGCSRFPPEMAMRLASRSRPKSWERC